MSDNLNLLDYECDDDQGVELLNQSADLEEEPMEQEVIMLEEEQPEDPGQGLACGGRDVFEEDALTNSFFWWPSTLQPRRILEFLPGLQKLRKLCNLYTICAGLWSLNKTTPGTHHRRVGRGTRGTQSLSFIC